MILTQCPVCAARLPDTSAKQCSRCKTRYCGPVCQKKHWEEGGHDKLCRKIRKGGGAEQFYASKKCAEAVAVAAEACAEDTKGQTCYICTQALHWKTKEGLVRGCSCRGTAGFAHVSCLAEQAKILMDEAEENNLGEKARIERWMRWDFCSLCKQYYHGVVACALGWACWKTYVGRPEALGARTLAMNLLGNGLHDAKHHEDALTVREAMLATIRRSGGIEVSILDAQNNLANTYGALGRFEEALRMRRDVYSGHLKLHCEEHQRTIMAANNYGMSLVKLERFQEAKSLLIKMMPVARRVLGEGHELTLKMRFNYARALYLDTDATLDDLREAVTTIECVARTYKRVFGKSHPEARRVQGAMEEARATLAARET